MLPIDLNLLRVFDALFELRSVTRAAERLGLTQSAISHALGRLRQAIGDPLFVRHTAGLQPTARALEIAPGVREGLARLRGALAPTPFDPATADRRFRISAGAYFCTLLIPELISRARRIAPRVSFTVTLPGTDLLASLDDGTIDVALGAFGKTPPRLASRPLFKEELVWIANIDNPILREPAKLADLPPRQLLEVKVGRPFPGHGSYSWEGGLERLVVTAATSTVSFLSDSSEGPSGVYDPLTAIATVAATELVALVPRRLAQQSARAQPIAIVETSTGVHDVDMTMLWHSRLTGDAGLLWLRQLILECLELY